MYAGAAYAAAPYAGGATTTTVTPDLSSQAPFLLIGDGIYVEVNPPVVVPNPVPGPGEPALVPSYRYVVALVYPTPDLVDGRPT